MKEREGRREERIREGERRRGGGGTEWGTGREMRNTAHLDPTVPEAPFQDFPFFKIKEPRD